MNRISHPFHMLCCDYCHRSEGDPCIESSGKLPPLLMYRLDNQCVICQECLAQGCDVEPDFLVDAESRR